MNKMRQKCKISGTSNINTCLGSVNTSKPTPKHYERSCQPHRQHAQVEAQLTGAKHHCLAMSDSGRSNPINTANKPTILYGIISAFKQLAKFAN